MDSLPLVHQHSLLLHHCSSSSWYLTSPQALSRQIPIAPSQHGSSTQTVSSAVLSSPLPSKLTVLILDTSLFHSSRCLPCRKSRKHCILPPGKTKCERCVEKGFEYVTISPLLRRLPFLIFSFPPTLLLSSCSFSRRKPIPRSGPRIEAARAMFGGGEYLPDDAPPEASTSALPSPPSTSARDDDVNAKKRKELKVVGKKIKGFGTTTVGNGGGNGTNRGALGSHSAEGKLKRKTIASGLTVHLMCCTSTSSPLSSLVLPLSIRPNPPNFSMS